MSAGRMSWDKGDLEWSKRDAAGLAAQEEARKAKVQKMHAEEVPLIFCEACGRHRRPAGGECLACGYGAKGQGG